MSVFRTGEDCRIKSDQPIGGLKTDISFFSKVAAGESRTPRNEELCTEQETVHRFNNYTYNTLYYETDDPLTTKGRVQKNKKIIEFIIRIRPTHPPPP